MSSTFNSTTTGDEVVSAFRERVGGRIFSLTGPAPGGLGSATLYSLAHGKPRALVLIGRNAAKLQPVVDQIKAIDSSIHVVLIDVDLSSFASVRAGAVTLLADDSIPHIDVHINNAAVVGPKELTVDGVETHFQVNHLSQFLFTALVLPKILKSSEPRIVNLTARAHAQGKPDWSAWNKTPGDDFLPWVHGYTQTKLANVLFTAGLVKKYDSKGLKAFSVHPGSILTELPRNLTAEQVQQLLQAAKERGWDDRLKTIEEGVSTTLVAALDPLLTPNGSYLVDCHVAEQSAHAYDEAKVNELWQLSEQITGAKFL
ncbi:WW domain-containing oxidoreductase [Exidia glandulosa HHB12029]|uniref:WW domain-containing oxidoreductase n=1 Tax=Exidia glandulosa HHB12029 TaxID=1314781 RepID=A0A165MKD8_EXIGL|nr:WW domain-containing oxidoreductase [Exidia glandulosa HHB12029]